jgi:hypothetical protein
LGWELVLEVFQSSVPFLPEMVDCTGGWWSVGWREEMERKEEKIGEKNLGEERMAEAFISWFAIFIFFFFFKGGI